MNGHDLALITLKNGIYDFESMEEHIRELKRKYPFVQVNTIGKSIMERPIYLLTIGRGIRRIHVNGSHHANEWITTYILMKSIEKLCEMMQNNVEIFDAVCYDFVPMVNPDGVTLCLYGLKSVKHVKMVDKLLKMNEGFDNFSRWKANIRGVDLNRNYNAGFMAYKKISQKKSSSYAYYAGSYPESEPETKALAELTRRRGYQLVLAFHTQGEVIYWNYDQIDVPLAKDYAIMFSEVSGYSLDEPEIMAAAGGYKDWFIKSFHKPGFTIECGKGENPIPISQALRIVKQTFPIIICAQNDLSEGAIKFGSL